MRSTKFRTVVASDGKTEEYLGDSDYMIRFFFWKWVVAAWVSIGLWFCNVSFMSIILYVLNKIT